MTRIYEALEQADKDRNNAAAPPSETAGKRPGVVSVREVMEEVAKEAAKETTATSFDAQPAEPKPVEPKPAEPNVTEIRPDAHRMAKSAISQARSAISQAKSAISQARPAPKTVQGPARKRPAEAGLPAPRAEERLPVRRDPSKIMIPQMEESLFVLYQNILSLLPDSRCRILQFIASTDGEGASTLAREFAKIASFRFGKRVLLLDADRRHPTHASYFGIKATAGWGDYVRGKAQLRDSMLQIGETPLAVSQASTNGDSPPLLMDDAGIGTFFDELREEYEMVVVDSPSATSAPEGLLLSRKADGVVLVVEAEKVRWQVVDKVKEKITKNGGNILGVALNKRRFAIPKFIYNRI